MNAMRTNCMAGVVMMLIGLRPSSAIGQSDLVNRWSMASTVQIHGTGDDEQYCQSPQPQLDCSTHASFGQSVSDQHVQGWFSDRLFVFNADMAPRATGSQETLIVWTYGILWLNPTVESTVSFNFSCDYSMPPGAREVVARFQWFTDESQTTFLYNDSRSAGPSSSDPRSGTLQMSEQIRLSPFPNGYVCRYEVRLMSLTGSPSEFTIADATVRMVLEPAACRPCGDLTCDGAVDDADLSAFILAMLDPAAYAAAYPGCDRSHADMNGDGSVDGLDIREMVLRLTAH